MAKKKKETGTYEWVSKTFNIQDGCPYICKYPCYARCIRRKKEDIWVKAKFKETWFNQKIENYEMGFLANVMCFSLHDIYPENQENCLKFIFRIMNESENIVLITSKANPDTIEYLCQHLENFRSRIRFMITITSLYDDVAKEWEPYAPLISERMKAVKYLNENKWDLNISIEPFHDKAVEILVETMLKKYWNIKTLWVGCNSIRNLKIHNNENLKFVQNEIRNLPLRMTNKIYYKNSFMDKLGD